LDNACFPTGGGVMTDDDLEVPLPKAHSAPEVVAPTNKVNVALPFGNIHIEESSKDLAELSRIVADLAFVIESLAPGPKVKALREQSQLLAARLR